MPSLVCCPVGFGVGNQEELQFLSSGDAGLGASGGSIQATTIQQSTTIGGQQPQPNRSGAGGVVEMFQNSSHPKIALVHVLFKIAVVLMYFFAGVFSMHEVTWIVVCIVLLSFDFWVVKNVTGRLMVGLRWWNNIREDGTNEWRYESVDNPDSINIVDYRIFWYSLYLTEIFWIVLGLANLLTAHFENLLIVAVAVTLNTSNLIGYYNCSKGMFTFTNTKQ